MNVSHHNFSQTEVNKKRWKSHFPVDKRMSNIVVFQEYIQHSFLLLLWTETALSTFLIKTAKSSLLCKHLSLIVWQIFSEHNEVAVQNCDSFF